MYGKKLPSPAVAIILALRCKLRNNMPIATLIQNNTNQIMKRKITPFQHIPTFLNLGCASQLIHPIITENECRQVISLAEASEWTTSRHYAVPTHDVAIHTIPALLSWFNTFMGNQVYPLLARQFQKNPNCFYVHDAFVVKYQAQQHHSYLPMHYDESTHSLVLTLNNDFEGGGTYFVDQDTVVNPRQAGCLVSFRGRQAETRWRSCY